MTPLRIGMIAPITHTVPPDGYGPWEQVVFDLVEALVALGHDVTLYAVAGSRTSARLVTSPAEPIEHSSDDRWFDPGPDPRVLEQVHIASAVEAAAAEGLDVLHSHLHVHALVFSRLAPCPMITTLHGSAWNRAHHPALRAYREQAFVSISDAERGYLPELHYVATVHNGIATDDFPLGLGGDHLLFAGRLAPEKAPDLAVAVARQCGRPLVIAGMIEDRHQDFFDAQVRPALADGDIDYVGDLSRGEMAVAYGRAAATVVPLRWDEPFGLVSVESMAAGTPVIAWRRGALPEIVETGVTGFVVAGTAEAAAAVAMIADIDRGACRVAVERRFSREVMGRGYVAAYEAVLGGR